MFQLSAEQVKGAVGRQHPHPVPAAAAVHVPHHRALRGTQGHEHRADRVSPVIAVWAGQSRGGHGQVAAGDTPHTLAMALATGSDTAP